MWIHLSETQAKSAHNYGIKWSCASAPFSAGFVHILKKKKLLPDAPPVLEKVFEEIVMYAAFRSQTQHCMMR